MKRLLFLFSILYIFNLNLVQAEVISGKINHDDINYQNRIIDSKSKAPLSGAKISIPDIGFTTYSDENGAFKLNANVNGSTVLFVEKDGYKIFSLTVDNTVLNTPLKLGIEQSSPFDLQITQSIVHLGDNMFSGNSANSKDFRNNAQGSYFSKTFNRPMYSQNQDVVIKIGTVIGLDTKKAKERGQNKIAHVWASPAEVYVNGHRIAHLELNGDNIEILVPKNILNSTNELVIQTGRNLFQQEYVDYDDIELANVRIEVKNHSRFARH